MPAESHSDGAPLVGVIMGSRSDWPTMSHAVEILEELGVAVETRIVSAHRTPDRLYAYAREARGRGIKAIVAGAGGAAHLPGMVASMTTLPVFGVPVRSEALSGLDKAGAVNAGLLAASVLALFDPALAGRLDDWRRRRTAAVPVDPVDPGS